MAVEALTVEVVYALPRQQVVVAVRVPAGATFAEAIGQSGILGRFPEIDLARDGVGAFGRRRRLDETVAAGDRIEIYRPLPADPKDARRRRAAGGRR